MLEIELKVPVEVANKADGTYQVESKVVVSFQGKKGVRAILRIQDQVAATFQGNNSNTSEEARERAEGKQVTKDDLMAMLSLTGNSDTLFGSVMKEVKDFAKIGGQDFSEVIQESMDMDDLQNVFAQVMRKYVLGKLIQDMNNLKK